MFLLRQHNTVAVAPAPAPQSPQFEPGGARSRAADLAQRHAFFVDAEEQARPGGSTGRWCAEVDRREGGIAHQATDIWKPLVESVVEALRFDMEEPGSTKLAPAW